MTSADAGRFPPAAASGASRRYSVLASSTTPALIIYLLDISGSMQQPLRGARRIDVVRDALQATIAQMVFRSSKGSRVTPRYRVAIYAYSDAVYDVLGGVRGIDELAATGLPELPPLRTTDTAKAFTQAEAVLRAELPRMSDHPAPLICHMTDGRYTGADPEPIVRRIMQLAVPDGNVLVENIYIGEAITHEQIEDAASWRGVTAGTRLASDYAAKLRAMSSPLPASYRDSLAESSYQLDDGALMLLPGTSAELVALGLQMSAATPVR